MKFVIVGGTGFFGSHLAPWLLAEGHEVVVASRSPKRAAARVARGVDTCGEEPTELAACLPGATGVVNLAGASLFGRRWSEEYKTLIRASRVETTQRIVDVIGALDAAQRPPVLVNASAVGYYGDRGDEELTESSGRGEGFLAEVAAEWEDAARPVEQHGTRLVLARLGVILGEDGGALEQMRTPFRLFVGGPVGSGRQYVSWIHVDDAVALVGRALTDDTFAGPMNVVAPEPVRFSRFAKAVGAALGRPSWLPAPAFALRIVFGEMADVLLDSTRVLPEVAREHGHAYRHGTVEEACADLLSPGKERASA